MCVRVCVCVLTTFFSITYFLLPLSSAFFLLLLLEIFSKLCALFVCLFVNKGGVKECP